MITKIIQTASNVISVNDINAVKVDLNDDGTVDVADIATVIDVMSGTSTSDKADVNGDGTVDVADIATVIDIMATR